MTEAEWLECTDPKPMLESLRQTGRLTGRKWRLFAVACCRRIQRLLPDERSWTAVEVAERFAEGNASEPDLVVAFEVAFDVGVEFTEGRMVTAAYAAWAASSTSHPDEAADGVAFNASSASADRQAERHAQSDLLRCLFGNPFRTTFLNPDCLNPTMQTLAKAAYEERIPPSGELDPARLAVLADALEESGCADTSLLSHLRQGGPHFRGCFALDAVLAKSGKRGRGRNTRGLIDPPPI